MIEFAQRRALESLLADEDASTRELLIREIGATREKHEALIRELASSPLPRVRESSRRILQVWNCGIIEPAAGPTDLPPCLQSWEQLETLCWLLAKMEYPDFHEAGHALTLQNWAQRVAEVTGGEHSPVARSKALRLVLAGEMGLQGNRTNYYAPENSYLNRVIETRRGIPLTLSLAYLFTARRLGWDAWGVSTPGHYLMSVEGCILDPYFGGVVVDPEVLAERFGLELETCRQPDFHKATPVETAQRMLANLLNSYLKQGDDVRYRRVNAYLKILQENVL
jgi:regulator of sirC expression with transglutaminase-like and TPR domain